MPRKPKFEPNELVLPKESCSIDINGVAYNFNSKTKPLRGDHPAVLSNPDLFQAVDAERPPA